MTPSQSLPQLTSAERIQLMTLIEQDSNHVSRETLERLEILVSQIVKWQRAINLIAPKTIESIWTRHIIDSAQLWPIIKSIDRKPERQNYDLGSGGGLPGLVLACMGLNNLRMVDSDTRKCEFLRQTAAKLGLSIQVTSQRLEGLANSLSESAPELITARALAPLPKMLQWISPMVAPYSKLILLKGLTWEKEVLQAREHFNFDLVTTTSLTQAEARILQISNLQPKGIK